MQLEALYVLGMFGVAMEISTPVTCANVITFTSEEFTLCCDSGAVRGAALSFSERAHIVGHTCWLLFCAPLFEHACCAIRMGVMEVALILEHRFRCTGSSLFNHNDSHLVRHSVSFGCRPDHA